MEAPSVAAIQRTLEEANFFHSAGSVRLEEGSSKRRLLTAVDSVAAGTTIGHIVPLIAVQNPLSTARSLSCSRCALNCGQVGLLIDFVAGDLSRQDAVAQLCSSGEGVCCTQGCGTLYCSATCRDADFEMHHRLLCVGLLEDAEHPLYQFKISAMQSGFFEIIHLAAQLISFFVAAETTVVHDGVPIDFDALCSQTMPHLRAVAGFAAGEEHDEDYFTVRDQCFRLLRDGLALSHNIDLETCFGGGALTSTFFAQVCEYLRRWGTVVELPSSLIDHSASLMDTFADDSAALDREVQRLKRVLKVLADEGLAAESDEEEDYSSVDGSNDDDSNASDAGKRDEEQGGGRIAEEELGVGRSGHRIGSGGGGGGGLGRSGASVSSDRSESTESEADNSRSLWDAVTSDDLVCDARKRFDGLKGFSGMALFPFAARVRHACSPLAELEMSLADASESVTRGGGSGGGAGGSAGAVDMTPGHLGLRATLTAAGQLNPNDEVTLCHITSAYDGDLSDDVAGRTQAITALGAPESVLQCISSGVGKDAQCACSKCQVQKGLADSVSVGELRGLLQRDLRQSNFADAGAILDSIAKRNADGQDDPETLYMRARIASWKVWRGALESLLVCFVATIAQLTHQCACSALLLPGVRCPLHALFPSFPQGRWNAAERLWEVAASRFPRHAKFATVLAHRDHYARVASAPSPADVALSSNAQQFKVDDYVEARWKGQWVGGRVACFWEEDETYNVLGCVSSHASVFSFCLCCCLCVTAAAWRTHSLPEKQTFEFQAPRRKNGLY